MKTVENQAAPTTTSCTPAGLGRRLGAALYDLLLVAAVVMVAAVPFVWVVGDTAHNAWVRFAFQLYLLTVIFLYYAWFWVRSGQTLGLLTWKLRVVSEGGEKITWARALLRFATASISLACVGLGFLWILFDRDKRAWHDRLSRTQVVHVRPHARTPGESA
jgi:uncharacterized RDD family membrane protein YckC